MVIGEAQKVITGFPGYDMDLGHHFVANFLEADPWVKSRQLAREFGGWLNDFTGASDAIQAAHESLDRGSRGNYLLQNQGPNETPFQRWGRVAGEVQAITGSAVGVRGDLETLIPSEAAPVAGGE